MSTCHGFQRESKEFGRGLNEFIYLFFIYLFFYLSFTSLHVTSHHFTSLFLEGKKKTERDNKVSIKAAFLKQTPMFSIEDSGTLNFMTGIALC